MKYTRKDGSCTVNAMQLDGLSLDDVMEFLGPYCGRYDPDRGLVVKVVIGKPLLAQEDDFVVQDGEGHFSVMGEKKFLAEYEADEEPEVDEEEEEELPVIFTNDDGDFVYEGGELASEEDVAKVTAAMEAEEAERKKTAKKKGKKKTTKKK